ncbi:heavy metal-binding domain-containing protein, partial [Acinetobacter baumannii]
MHAYAQILQGDLHAFVTTSNSFDGFRVVRNLGVVRGITVRSRSVFGQIGAGL